LEIKPARWEWFIEAGFIAVFGTPPRKTVRSGKLFIIRQVDNKM